MHDPSCSKRVNTVVVSPSLEIIDYELENQQGELMLIQARFRHA